MTKRLNKVLDGCYTRMLKMALNVNQYRDRVSNAKLYGDLPRVSFKVRQKCVRLAGHAIRHPELPLSKVILWKPVHGHRGRGCPRATYIDFLLIDTGVETALASLRHSCWTDWCGEESSWILWQLPLTKLKSSQPIRIFSFINSLICCLTGLF